MVILDKNNEIIMNVLAGGIFVSLIILILGFLYFLDSIISRHGHKSVISQMIVKIYCYKCGAPMEITCTKCPNCGASLIP